MCFRVLVIGLLAFGVVDLALGKGGLESQSAKGQLKQTRLEAAIFRTFEEKSQAKLASDNALKSTKVDFRICSDYAMDCHANTIVLARNDKIATKSLDSTQNPNNSAHDSRLYAQNDTPKMNKDITLEINPNNFDSSTKSPPSEEKQLYFLRAQYYQYLKSQARAQENRARSGAFIGVVLGASNMDITLQRLGKPYGASISPFAIGASGGYMHFIDSAPLGIRFYGQYLAAWNSSNNIQDSVTMQLFSFNLDMFGDLAITDDGYYLGAYAGVGGGVAIFNQNLENVYRQHQVIAGSVLNLGLSVTLAYHHRLEAGVKVPPSVVNENFTFKLMYLVSYQYLF